MRILIVDSYYPRFLSSALSSVLTDGLDYAVLRQQLLNLRFGTADFYSRHLVALGNEAEDLIFNCEPLQRLWAQEHGQFVARENGVSRLWRRVTRRLRGARVAADEPLLQVAIRQIRAMRPDVLYLQDLNLFPPDVLKQLREEGSFRIAVGQIACPLPDWEQLAGLDLILTSFPHYVGRFRERGISSEYFRIGFDPIVLDDLGPVERDLPCTFVGGISPAHAGRLGFLESLAEEVDIAFYGYGADTLNRSSPIVPRHHGEAWSLDMYRALARSRLTVNIHIDVAENHANNMRLYEATGCGALLVTDQKDNLAQLFEPDREVVTYSSTREAVEKIRYYLEHPSEAAAIARAGQARTLREHTYAHRIRELMDILPRYL